MRKRNPDSSTTRTAMASPQDTHSQGDLTRKLNNLGVSYSSFIRIRTHIQELRPPFIEILCAPDFRNCKAADEIRAKIKFLEREHNKMSTKTKAGKEQDGQQQKESVSEKSPNNVMFGIQTTTEKNKARRDQDGKQQKESVSEKSPNKAMSGIQTTTEKNKAGRDQDCQKQKQSVSEKAANRVLFGSSKLEGKHLTSGYPNPIPLKVVNRSMSGNIPPGSYIVGGSAPGWNFIIYDGKDRTFVGESPPGWNFITYGYKKPCYYGVTKEKFLKKRKERPN